MCSKRGEGGWLGSDARGGGDGNGGFADSVSQGVFVLRKAPALSKRPAARKSFVPLVSDETIDGMEARRDAYLQSWRQTDDDIQAVLADANRDAFEKLTSFVMDGFVQRQQLVTGNGGARLPQHSAQRIPVGLVLAGGVNSDDHEETFSKLTQHLRGVGCHTALLRSRDLKARGGSLAANALAAATAADEDGGGGGGDASNSRNSEKTAVSVSLCSSGAAGGGLGVAVRRILEQLQHQAARRGVAASKTQTRVSGRSVRHLRRWYVDVTEKSSAEISGDDDLPVDVNAQSTDGNMAGEEIGDDALHEDEEAVGGASGLTRKSPVGAAKQETPTRFGKSPMADKTTTTATRKASLCEKKLPPAPVVIVLEDTEGFDSAILRDLLLALSDAGDEIPVCVLLGLATSAQMVHSMLPAAVAARLNARAFKLYSPKSVMAAVQSRALMDPCRVPALSNAALELLATRFKEHDFSLSAAKRAMHLLTLDHFMQTPLSALAPAAAAGAGAGADEARQVRRELVSGRASGGDTLITTDDVVRDIARDDARVNRASSSADLATVTHLAQRAKRVAAAAAAAAVSAAERVVKSFCTEKSCAWARKHLVLPNLETGVTTPGKSPGGTKHVACDAMTKQQLVSALTNAYPARRRWGLALRCVAVAAETCSLKSDKGELSNVFVDASSTRWMEGIPLQGGGGQSPAGNRAEAGGGSRTEKGHATDTNGNGGSRGDSLLRLIRARLERPECSVFQLKALCRRWARLVAVDPELHACYAQALNQILSLCDESEDGEENGHGVCAEQVETFPTHKSPAAAKRNVVVATTPTPKKTPTPARSERETPTDVHPPSTQTRRAAQGGTTQTDHDARGTPNEVGTLRGTPQRGENTAVEPASVEPPGVEKSRHEEPRSETVTERRARQSEENESSDASDLASPDGAAVAAALVARRRAGPERARALEVAAAERGRQRRDDDTDTALDKDTSREMDADAPLHESGATLGRGTSAAANEKKVSRADEARRGASAFLVSITKKHASSPPSSLPGMEIFCVTSTTRLRSAVQAAPRLALEQQMATPFAELRCSCCPEHGGASPSLPDACAAYVLLQDAGDAANVHEWFRAFCELHAPARAKGGNDDTRGARGGTKTRGMAPAPDDDDDGDAAAAAQTGKETFSLDKRKLWELQARFTRAAAELEFLGVARPVKRRKVEYMQRTAFPLDQLLGDDGG